jgi:hypothetical protein
MRAELHDDDVVNPPPSSTSSLRLSFSSNPTWSREDPANSFISVGSDYKDHISGNYPSSSHDSTKSKLMLERLLNRVNRLEEELHDSLNCLTDRLNTLESKIETTVIELRIERKQGHDMIRKTICEVTRRLLAFLRRALITRRIPKQRVLGQSRIGMTQDGGFTSVRE